MIERRGFLSLLGLGAAGLIVPTLPKILVYEPEAALLPVADTFIPVGLQSITQALAMELDRMLDGKTTVLPVEARVGDTLRRYLPIGPNTGRRWEGSMFSPTERVNMTDQINVGMPIYSGDHASRKRYIEPAAHALADRIKLMGLNTFAKLPMPVGGMEAAMFTSGSICLRGVQGFRRGTDELITRFDLIGGHA